MRDLSQLFGGRISGVGGTFIQDTNPAVSVLNPGQRANMHLAGEPDVMMISGVGVPEGVSAPPGVSTVGQPATNAPLIPPQSLTGQMQLPVTIGSFTLPLWQWFIIAALLGGAGGYYLGRR